MKSRLAGALALLSVALLASCTPALPAAPAASPVPSAAPNADAEWNALIAAAKQEGGVSVTGPAGTQGQTALADAFTKQFGIPVDYFGGPGRDIAPRVANERAAGQYLWDVYVGGTTTALVDMMPKGEFTPLAPWLVLPDVKNPATWRGGLQYADDSGSIILVMTPFQQGTIFTNTNVVPAGTFKSYKDLLDPKWKGKILVDDPRVAGSGQATFSLLYLHPDLGPDFIRALASQDLTFSRDFQQEIDLLGRGEYPVALGATDDQVKVAIQKGLPISIVDAREIKEFTEVSPATGAVAVYDHPAHPNATKLYVNWLLSKEGQTQFGQAEGYPSARVDVSNDWVEPWRIPIPGAINVYDQKSMAVKDPLTALLKETFPNG